MCLVHVSPCSPNAVSARPVGLVHPSQCYWLEPACNVAGRRHSCTSPSQSLACDRDILTVGSNIEGVRQMIDTAIEQNWSREHLSDLTACLASLQAEREELSSITGGKVAEMITVAMSNLTADQQEEAAELSDLLTLTGSLIKDPPSQHQSFTARANTFPTGIFTSPVDPKARCRVRGISAVGDNIVRLNRMIARASLENWSRECLSELQASLASLHAEFEQLCSQPGSKRQLVENILLTAMSNLTEDQQDEGAELSDLLTFISSLPDDSFQSLNLSVSANLQLAVIKKLSQGPAQKIEAPAVAEDPKHTAFFQALCAAKEELLAGEDDNGPALLKLGADVIFPKLRASQDTGQGDPPALLVRQCWNEFRDLILQQGNTLVIGIPGIGKSVFAWWFARCLAALGFTVVYRSEKANKTLLCKDGRVLAGAHGSFDYLQEETKTWWVYDAMEPDDVLISKSSRILVVSLPNRDRYKNFETAPGVKKMIMPRWSQEEIKLALQHLYPAAKYPGMTTARVDNLFIYYNGVPRFVLGKPSENSGPDSDRLDLLDFNNAVSSCEASQVLRGAVVYESVAEKYHRLLHLVPTSSNYRLCKTVYASGQAFLRVWERAGAEAAAALQAYWKSSAGDSAQTSMRGQILEEITKMDLASRCTTYDERRLLRWFGAETKSYTAKQRQQVEAPSKTITIEPGRRLQFTFDNTRYAQQLQDSWQQPGAWSGRTLLTPVGTTYPEVDCVMLPAPKAAKADCTVEQVELVELYQITAGDDKDIDRKILANILCALPDAKKYILYFVVPKEDYLTFTVKSISREIVSKQGQARLNRLEARVIANVEGVDALHSYMSISSSSSKDVVIEDGEEDIISGSEEGGSQSDSADSATTVLHADE